MLPDFAVTLDPITGLVQSLSGIGLPSNSVINWQPDWRELDLLFGLAVDASGATQLLDPSAYATVPRDGVQLPDVSVIGSVAADRIHVAAGSRVEAGDGADELFNSDSLGGNLLVGGAGADRFLLRAAGDTVIGGDLLANAAAKGLPAVVALADGEPDAFVLDSSNPAPAGVLQILDYEPGRDALLLDGVAPTGNWAKVRQQLQVLGIQVNAVPQISGAPLALTLLSGVEVARDLGALASDPDGDPLKLVKLEGPDWLTTTGTTLKAIAPADLRAPQLALLPLRLAFSDGKAVVPFSAQLSLNAPPASISLAGAIASLPENTNTANRIKVADIVISDDAFGANGLSLSGPDAASFELDGTSLFLRAGTTLNFEAKATYSVTVNCSDPALLGSTPLTAPFVLSVADLNEAPTGLSFTNSRVSLPENTSTASRVKVADIVINDDALGSNGISLSGPDAASFEVDASSLFLRAGTTLDVLVKTAYAVTVSGFDASLPGSPPVSSPYALTISDFYSYKPGPVTINGLNRGSTPSGYALRTGSNPPLQITAFGSLVSPGNPGEGWTALAGVPREGTISLYWQNSGSGRYARWSLKKGNGALVGGEFLTAREFYEEENSVGADLNNDGVTGLPVTPGPVTIQGLRLVTTPLGYAFQSGTTAPVPIMGLGGFVSEANPGAGWRAVAVAAASEGIINLYWQNSGSGRYARWSLKASSGALIDGEFLSGARLREGGPGDDLRIGGPAADTFAFATGTAFNSASQGVDAILGFNPAQDQISLSRLTFTALPVATTLPPSLFASVSSESDAAGSEAVIVYNSSNGHLYYNPNGPAAGFATNPSGGGLFGQLLSTDSGASFPALVSTSFLLTA